MALPIDDEDALDVLDLPQLYTKPSAQVILATLFDLSSGPPSWDTTPSSTTPRSALSGMSTPLKRPRKVRSEGVPGYLTRIISSPLTWIEDISEKEAIWEHASQRLSERSGRTGMAALSRTFRIPLAEMTVEEYCVEKTPLLEVTLHEPALTADNVGFKTWASSYLLAKRLVLLREKLLASATSTSRPKQVLELGAGTGLVGIAAAFILGTYVLLTDLPAIVPNLERNVRENTLLATQPHGNVDVGILDWSNPLSLIVNGELVNRRMEKSFSVILAADSVYDIEHASLLPKAIAALLSHHKDARFVLEIPLREGFLAQRELLKLNMDNAGLVIDEDGEEVGYDDWSTADGEGLAEVTCWWSIWKRQ